MIERKRLKPEPTKRQAKAGKTLGRPSTYKPEYAKLAAAHCKLGATDADLATLFDVTTQCIWLWTTKHPEFGAAVHSEKAGFDRRVERSLAQRALGYSVDTEEIKVTKDGGVIRVPVRKHYPPETVACIFWLKNRQPEAWRDVQRHEHSGKLDLDKTTAEQLLADIRKEAAELGILPLDILPLTKGVAPIGANGKTKH